MDYPVEAAILLPTELTEIDQKLLLLSVRNGQTNERMSQRKPYFVASKLKFFLTTSREDVAIYLVLDYSVAHSVI
jgi:hypothetical protein